MNATLPDPDMPSSPFTRDFAHLDLLAVFHYVVAAITALCGSFPLIHVVLGSAMLFAPESVDSRNPPPAFIGGLFLGIGLFVILLAWSAAALLVFAGNSLRRRRHWMFCMVVAGFLCVNMPIGTILGVCTILVLLRDPVKEAFGEGVARTDRS